MESSKNSGITVGTSVGRDQIVKGNLSVTINHHANSPPSSSQASAHRRTPFRCNLPLPGPNYQGREDILKSILDHFKDASTKPIKCWSRIVTIVGMGGIGKSETASMFANKYRENYPCAAWIDAETKETALDSFLSLAKSLKIVSETHERADLDLVKRVYRHIDAEYLDPVLLIFDNAVQLHSRGNDFGIYDFLPTQDLVNKQYPFVIITSQMPGWGMTKDIQLEELSEEDSILFYRRTFGISSSACDEAFKKLHIQLQGYPLAMNLAASNIDFQPHKHLFNWLQDEIELYLKKFEEEDSSILAQNISQNSTSRYNKTLSTVWQLCFQKLKTQPNALMLLQAVSFFHVPVNTFRLERVFIECNFCPGTPDWMKYSSLKESIRLLEKYHLVHGEFRYRNYSSDLKALQSNTENNSEDLSSEFKEEVKRAKSFWCELKVHRLVQLVVRLGTDCSEVLEDIIRVLAVWTKLNYVPHVNMSAVEEALRRTTLSTRALAFVGLLALQGNSVARRIIQSSTAPVNDPAATIWRVLQLDKNIKTLNEEAIQVLRAFIGLSRFEKTLIDKRCFANMALIMFAKRRIFSYARDDGTPAPGIFLQSFAEIEGIACELFSTGCSFTDVCDLPLLCRNSERLNAAIWTVHLGNRLIKDLTKANRPETRIAQLTEELRTYREFADRSKNKLHQFIEEMIGTYGTVGSWDKLESEVESCGLDQQKLKQVFSSIFDKIWLATDKKNLDGTERLGLTFRHVDFVIYQFLKFRRPREILIPLMESFVEILVKTEKEQLAVLQDPEENYNNAAIWICSIWMKFCIQRDCLGSDDLVNCLSRVRILIKMNKISIDRIRHALQIFCYWDVLQKSHKTMYDEFMEIYSESPVEEIRTLVTFCKEIQLEMSAYAKQLPHRT